MSILPRTQDHLEIIDIRDNVVVLSGGKFRLVFEATAINFDLLSEDEQNATIFAYANLVNSIDYPIQIVIRTRRVDITSYIDYLNEQLHEQPTGALRDQLQDYMDFIQQLVLENTVLQKRFYVVLPYWQGASAATTKSNTGGLAGLLPFGKKKESVNTNYSKDSLAHAKVELEQKFEELKWQFNRLGIKVHQLETQELIRLYYEVYNPEAGENQGVNQDVFGYTSGFVTSTLPNPNKPEAGAAKDKPVENRMQKLQNQKDNPKEEQQRPLAGQTQVAQQPPPQNQAPQPAQQPTPQKQGTPEPNRQQPSPQSKEAVALHAQTQQVQQNNPNSEKSTAAQPQVSQPDTMTRGGLDA